MGQVYFASDLHLGHRNIAKFRCKEKGFFRDFQDEIEHRSWLKEEWNKKVNKRDKVFCLGDICFSEEALEDFKTWTGTKVLIAGNHCCDNISMKDIVNSGVYSEVYSLLKYKEFWLSHAPIHENELRGKYNIHGHCIPAEAEILTLSGWKSKDEIILGDEVYSLNPSNMLFEKDIVLNTFTLDAYNGPVYSLEAKGLSVRVTEKHKIPFLDANNKFKMEEADRFFNRSVRKIIKAGNFLSEGIDLSDDELRLYIVLVTDGYFSPTLARVSVQKERKVKNIVALLSRLNITYTKYFSKGTTRFNFRLPEKLEGWGIKGLDIKLTQCNRHQAEIIKETYSWTDGNRNLIFTSKKCEVDILQHLFVINGFSCKVHSRSGHGFSKTVSYQLSVTDKQTQVLVSPATRHNVEANTGEDFWCIENKNHNFLVRYKGSVMLTGNCHYYRVEDWRYYNSCVEHGILHKLEDVRAEFAKRKQQREYCYEL